MSKKPTTTRDAMLDAALQLIREQGVGALTVRSLSARLGCSTQPIMYQFPTVAELREAVYQHADAFHSAYLMVGHDLLDIGLRYIRFADEEPNLFRFLFQSGRFADVRLQDLIRAPEAAGLIEVVAADLGATRDDAAALFEPLYVAVHGYASLIANNAMAYEPDTIRRTLIALAGGLERGYSEGEDEV